MVMVAIPHPQFILHSLQSPQAHGDRRQVTGATAENLKEKGLGTCSRLSCPERPPGARQIPSSQATTDIPLKEGKTSAQRMSTPSLGPWGQQVGPSGVIGPLLY